MRERLGEWRLGFGIATLALAAAAAGACSASGGNIDEAAATGTGTATTSTTATTATGGGGAGGSGSGGSATGGSGGSACECQAASECPQPDTACITVDCVSCACVTTPLPEGMALPQQTMGDCHQMVCMGGTETPSVDDTDLPDDTFACTENLCNNGVPQHPPTPAGTACMENGGKVCDGAGACVECASGADCASFVCKSNVCAMAACDDGVKNGAEADVDCGGPTCNKCGLGKGCGMNSDCADGKCQGTVCAAGGSCFELSALVPKPKTGVYMIDPDGGGVNAPFAVYCDMDTDGGGWSLLATLKSTSTANPATDPTAWANAWSDDWWTKLHGTPTDPNAAFSNHDMRKFKPLVSTASLLRVSTPNSATKRFHFGFGPTEWDFWNQGRTVQNVLVSNLTVNIIGPFFHPNGKVATNVNKAGATDSLINGHWFGGILYLGTLPGGADNDNEGLGARFHVGTSSGNFGYVAGAKQDAKWHLWLR